MSELWVKKLPTDVHRLIDNKLPEGSKCTGVTVQALDEGMVEEFVATINGEEVIVQAPTEESANDVADAIVAQAPPPPPPPEPTEQIAQLEGAEITEADEAMGGPVPEEEYEYDDSDEDDEDEVSEFDAPPKPKKAKTKKKK